MQNSLLDFHFHYALDSREPRRNMEIYKAVDKLGNKLRVYKIRDEDLFFQLKDRIQAISEHPNFEKLLISNFEKNENGFEGYFVFERYRGLSFGGALARITYPLQLLVVSELANGIRYLHGAGICHGGITQNCFYSQTLKIPVIGEPLGGCFPNPADDPAPEQIDYPDEVFPGTDVWHMGNFLQQIGQKPKGLPELIQECRRANPEKRPAARQINEILRDLYTLEAIQSNENPWQERIQAGIRTLGLGVLFLSGYLYMDHKYESKTHDVIRKSELQVQGLLQEERRNLFMKWNAPLLISQQNNLTLGSLAERFTKYYKKPIVIPVEHERTELLMENDLTNWDEVVEANGFQWAVMKNGEIKIFVEGSVSRHYIIRGREFIE